MLKIKHRINTIEALKNTPQDMGVEVDIRSEGTQLILHHDPFQKGEAFNHYLEHFKHAFIILNVKTEGIEERVIQAMRTHSIHNYFFLDLSIPFLVKTAKKGERKIAVRYSEYEPLFFTTQFKTMVNWVWIDCFKHLPLTQKSYQELRQNFKLCLVSPELQGHPKSQIPQFKQQLQNMPCDAVCTKYPEAW